MTMRTVLVVEDQEGLADLYEVWLEQEYDIRTAYNTRQAKEALDEEIDVALLDRRLPDGSGDDVLAMIRDQDIDAKVAMITAVEEGLTF